MLVSIHLGILCRFAAIVIVTADVESGGKDEMMLMAPKIGAKNNATHGDFI